MPVQLEKQARRRGDGKMSARTVIVSGARTPFGKFGGSLKGVPAVRLGGEAIKEAVERAGLRSEQVEKTIMGMALQGGAGQNPARQAARLAGLPWDTPAETVSKVCASGLRAITLADQVIRAGDTDIVAAGGMESMSSSVHALAGLRWGNRMGNGTAVDLMIHDGLQCPFDDVHMAVHGSNVAKEYGVSRQEQDDWALRSHLRAVRAIEDGKFREEIVPIRIPGRNGTELVVDRDEAPRADTSPDALSRLLPVFVADGTITAGNAPGVNDGAAALILMSEDKASELGTKPLARILGHAESAQEAPYIATAPALAIQKLLAKTGHRIEDIDLFEVNEAFAAVVLTSGRIAGWDPEKVNVNGGAVALGHPIGASGARIVLTLVHELRRRGGGLGVAAICSGTAQGDAVLVQV
ncbi:acetyl-CoA C-acetyltransferase [Paenibacillus sp. LHD-117]|uniref:acetyl-CoA C-acetyltransferase n=1 Tax=Paenibacillus sp. LHD-117 TaxID=3071412 RepID=UPI0027DFA7FD|nr:acetyl-CoA C-acetyltransferase [Paenibacillus sp. LHD-117]MDQ6421564.1 acetyl-CoA C-acetyltransferase [Paenibacillus sp. LHD-117]